MKNKHKKFATSLGMSPTEWSDFINSMIHILNDNYLPRVIKHKMTIEDGIIKSLQHLMNVNETIIRLEQWRLDAVADALCDTIYNRFNEEKKPAGLRCITA